MRQPETARWALGLVFAMAAACGARAHADEPGIFVMRAEGGGERRVITVPGVASHRSPRWSHDGRRLAFEGVDDRGGRKTYVVNLDGTGLVEIGEFGSPDWSPDDKQLVLESNDWNEEEVFVQNVDGGGKTRLADGAWPRWSPDGRRIAFCDGNILKVLDLLDDGGELALCVDKFAQRPGAFDWSRDGKRLALFTRTTSGGPRELYIVDVEGKNDDLKPRFSRPGSVGAHVSWSPDDKRLYFTIESAIHSLDVDDPAAQPRLVSNPSNEDRDPAISPDGKWIAFARRPLLSPRR